MNMVRGFATTIKHVLRLRSNTRSEERRYANASKAPRAKRYENGWNGASAARYARRRARRMIWVEAAENTDEERYSPASVTPRRTINMLRCTRLLRRRMLPRGNRRARIPTELQ